MAEKKPLASDKKVEKATGENKKKALETALAGIEKQFGKGAVMRLGQNTVMKVDVVPTGSFGLDIALGVGGLPRGRIVEVYGPESSGKTTLALHCVAEAQKLGGEAAFIDVEHALDPAYAEALGVDIDNLLVAQPDTGEDALEICESLVRSGAIDIIVVDSVAALVPKAEVDNTMGAAMVGAQARLMSSAMRKLAGIISKSGCVTIFINQLREKIGVSYGNPEVTTGGRALKFYASVRLEVKAVEKITKGTERIGAKTRVKVVKNKMAPPFKEAFFDVMFGVGIERSGEILDAAVKLDIVHKSGAWFSYKENRIGQGRDKTKDYLDKNPDIAKEIEEAVFKNADKLMSMKPAKSGKKAAIDDDSDEDDEILLSDDGVILDDEIIEKPVSRGRASLDIEVD